MLKDILKRCNNGKEDENDDDEEGNDDDDEGKDGMVIDIVKRCYNESLYFYLSEKDIVLDGAYIYEAAHLSSDGHS